MNSPIGFSDWYKARLGHLPVLGQGALWYLRGVNCYCRYSRKDSRRTTASNGRRDAP
jgi:hypothetical protein